MNRGLDAQIFVCKDNHCQDGLYISRNHLLSTTYIQEMNGKYLPLYSLIQWPEIGLNLKQFTSIFELQVCVAKYIKFKDLQFPKLLQADSSRANKVIEAVPLSYKLPYDYDITAIKKGKLVARPHLEEQVTSSAENDTKTKWLKDWTVQLRQRKNGKYDKYYYHKNSSIMCRSLVEVDNYQLHGILPKHLQKAKKDISPGQSVPPASKEARQTSSKWKRTSQKFDSCSSKPEAHEILCFPFNNSTEAESAEATEKFLEEAYSNLLNAFGGKSKSSSGKKRKIIEEVSKEKKSEESNGKKQKTIAESSKEKEEEKYVSPCGNLINIFNGESEASSGKKKPKIEKSSDGRRGESFGSSASQSRDPEDYRLVEIPIKTEF